MCMNTHWNIIQPLKGGDPAFVTTQIDFEVIMLREISQVEKDRCHMISFICGIWKK